MTEYALTLVLNGYRATSLKLLNTVNDEMRVYGLIFTKGFWVPKNPSEAVRYNKMAIEKGDTKAMKRSIIKEEF